MALLSACLAVSTAVSSEASLPGTSASRLSLSTTPGSFLCSAEMLLGNCGSRLWRFDLGASGFVGVGRPENPGCRMFSGSAHRAGGLRAVNGTSIIEVGLARPAAAPGGRRVDGSRLGVAISRRLRGCERVVGRVDRACRCKERTMLFIGGVALFWMRAS